MTRFQLRGVDRSRRRGVDQAGSPAPLDDDHPGVMEDPLFLPWAGDGLLRKPG
jgi:hypothetical protein